MLHRTIIALVLFELIFVIITGVSSNVFRDPSLLLFNVCFVLWLAMESMRVRLGHEDARTFGRFSRIFLIVSFGSIMMAIWERAMDYPIIVHSLPTAAMYAGIVFFAVGVYLRHLSIKSLGKYFVTKVQVTNDHELVTEGIYRFVRHPSYTGLIFGFLGLILFLQAGSATILFITIAIPAYIYRIKIEEDALINTFGQQYETYRKSSYALLPLIY